MGNAMKRKATAWEKRHMAKVARMGCIVCEMLGYPGMPAEVHHVRMEVGWGRDGHFNTIPLCMEHHRGNTGIHMMGRNRFAEMYGYGERELLAFVNARLGRKP